MDSYFQLEAKIRQVSIQNNYELYFNYFLPTH